MASKYEQLRSYLQAMPGQSIPMTFTEIERVLGRSLPPSSRRHRAWWSNNPTNNVMTHAWLAAGFETADVDLAGERLVFRRAAARSSAVPVPVPDAEAVQAVATVLEYPLQDEEEDGEPVVCRHPLFGALRGMISVEPGQDLTRPLFEEGWWDKRMDEKYRDL